MKKLQLAKDLTFPLLEAVTQTIAILGKRGSGKTTTATVFVEELLEAGQHTVVLDPLDVWWGLRASKDGKKAGFPITVLGGDHADLPLEASAGAVIAEFVVEHHAPLILSLRHFSMAEQRRFVTDFCEKLYGLKGQTKNRTALHLVIDEADEFAPQRIQAGHERMFGAIDRIVRRGRASGLGVTLISQRAAVVNKDVLSQAEVLICHQTISPQDRKALEAWIHAHDAHDQRGTFMESLASLNRGEAWVWSPGWLNIFQRTQIRDRTTFDSSATPKAGQAAAAPKQLAGVDLEQLQERMASTIEKAKADDPRELRKQIAQLQRDLAHQQTAAVHKTPAAVHKPALTDADRALLEKVALLLSDAGRWFEESEARADERLQAAFRGVLAERETARTTNIERASKAIVHQLESKGLQKVLAKLEGVAVAAPGPGAPIRPRVTPPVQRRASYAPEKPTRQIAPQNADRSPRGDNGLGAGELKILTAIAQHEDGVTREQLTVLTGYKRSSRDTYLQRLSQRGLISVGADIRATDAGVQALGPGFEPLPKGLDLQAYWLDRLPSGERAILEPLIEAYPGAVDREQLSTLTGYKRSSRDTYLQRLSSRQLISVQRDGVKASDVLFD